MVDGFSSADPFKARGPQISAGEATRRRAKGRSSGGSSRKPNPNVRISGDTVFINNQGFSVAPSLQESFIQQKTGGRGSSAQQAIAMAKQTEIRRVQEEARKLQELKEANEKALQEKLKKAKTATERANAIAINRKVKRDIQRRETRIFQEGLKSGRIQGFSGIGLSPSQLAKRKFLIKTGALKEMSSKEAPFRTVDALTSQIFIDRIPTKQEKEGFINYLRRKQHEFDTEVRIAIKTKDPSKVKRVLEKVNLFRGLRASAKKIDMLIADIKKFPNIAETKRLNEKVLAEKGNYIDKLKRVKFITSNVLEREASVLALFMLSEITKIGGNLPAITKALGEGSVAVVKGTPTVVKKAPDFVKKIYNNPEVVIVAGVTLGEKAIKRGTTFVKLLLVEPGTALGKVGTEYLIFKGVGKGAKVVGKRLKIFGKLNAKAARQVSPAFKEIKAISIVIRKAPKSVVKAKGIGEKIKKFKSAVEFEKELALARKIRKRAKKKGGTVKIGTYDYVEAVVETEEKVKALARVKAKRFVEEFKKKGGTMGLGDKEDFIKAFERMSLKRLEKLQSYKTLKEIARLTKPAEIRFKKVKKIGSAKKLYQDISTLLRRIDKNPQIKELTNMIREKIVTGKKFKKGVKKLRQKVKAERERVVKEFKSAIQYNKELKKAKRRQKKSLKRKGIKSIKKVVLESSDYMGAIELYYDFAEQLSILRGRAIIAKLKKLGKVIDKRRAEEIYELTSQQARKSLEEFSEFKKLKELARLRKPAAIREIKLRRAKRAKDYFNSLSSKLSKKFSTTKASKILEKVSKKTRDITRKAKPKRLVKSIKKRVRESKSRRIKPTDKIIKISAKNIKVKRIMTPSRIRTIEEIKKGNRVIDELFDEMAARRSINIDALNYRQLRNIIKKKLARAIRRNDRETINKLKTSFFKMIRELDSPRKNPTIKVVEKVNNKKRIRTIKDFTPETPKGSYAEVRSGQQVLLQKLETPKLKLKGPSQRQVQVQKPVQITEKVLVKSVQKASIDLKPLTRFSAFALASNLTEGMLSVQQVKSSNVLAVAQKVSQSLATEVKTLQKMDNQTLQNVAQAVNQAKK